MKFFSAWPAKVSALYSNLEIFYWNYFLSKVRVNFKVKGENYQKKK